MIASPKKKKDKKRRTKNDVDFNEEKIGRKQQNEMEGGENN